MKRRDFLMRCSLPALMSSRSTRAAAAGEIAAVEFLLKETAGLRRFGYPVRVELPAELTAAATANVDFRLTRDGQDVPAQFRRAARPDGHGLVTLDFNSSPGPFQVETYRVERSSPAKPSSSKGSGMGVRNDRSIIRISHPPYIEYAIADDLAGWVQSVKVPATEFIKQNSSGLFVVVNGRKITLPTAPRGARSDSTVRVGRQGPLAVGLQSHQPIATSGPQPVDSKIDLTFPSSKSWIETVWTVNDPLDQIEAMGLDLALELDSTPLLVDCGAKSTVYAVLKLDDVLTFDAGKLPAIAGVAPSWVIRHATRERSHILATMERKEGNEPEGWIHLMDQKRCTAIAVADFGRAALATIDHFDIHGDGRFGLERRFLTEKTGQGVPRNPIKTLRYWLHFVTNPVQVGALTSPQAMLAPLQVEWSPPARSATEPN